MLQIQPPGRRGGSEMVEIRHYFHHLCLQPQETNLRRLRPMRVKRAEVFSQHAQHLVIGIDVRHARDSGQLRLCPRQKLALLPEALPHERLLLPKLMDLLLRDLRHSADVRSEARAKSL